MNVWMAKSLPGLNGPIKAAARIKSELHLRVACPVQHPGALPLNYTPSPVEGWVVQQPCADNAM